MRRAISEQERVGLTERNKEISVGEEAKAGREDAYDGIAYALQGHGLSKHLDASAEARSPKQVADDGDWGAAVNVFCRCEFPAECGFYTPVLKNCQVTRRPFS